MVAKKVTTLLSLMSKAQTHQQNSTTVCLVLRRLLFKQMNQSKNLKILEWLKYLEKIGMKLQ